MPIHHFEPPRGRIESFEIDSAALRNNLLGDPVQRNVWIYLPEGYDRTDTDYPLLVDLVGFTGSGPKHLAWTGFGESVPQRLDRLVAAGEMGPVVLAFPDCFTSLGGNQYVNSAAMGLWEDFLIDEMLPRIEADYRVRPGAGHRGVFGKSSGGYGALFHAMRHAEAWGAAASHSGDCGFELLFRRDFPVVCDMLARHEGSIPAFLRKFEGNKKVNGAELHVLMILAMAATYAPDPAAPKGIRLPFDLRTCEVDETEFDRWLAWDPLLMVDEESTRENLSRLKGLYIDCGSRDQYFIHYGTRALVDKLKGYAISHQYEEFDDNHSSVDYRMDVSLPYLYRALTA